MKATTTIYIGIDQVGAVNSKGQPRPLPACRLRGSQFEFVQLKEFTQAGVKELTGHESASIVLDCVLGLPMSLGLDWRDTLKLLRSERRFGRAAAEEFFERIGGGHIWYRQVERLAKANSLFRSRPFQKNIQTGTYRFWVEMARDPDWFAVPWLPNEKKSDFKIYEGYPRLLWKRLFDQKTRKPTQLVAMTSEKFGLNWTPQQVRLIEKDHNFADALVLALAGRKLLKKNENLKVNMEGWILGVSPQ